MIFLQIKISFKKNDFRGEGFDIAGLQIIDLKKIGVNSDVNGWGCINFYGPGICCKLDKTLNKAKYIIILEIY